MIVPVQRIICMILLISMPGCGWGSTPQEKLTPTIADEKENQLPGSYQIDSYLPLLHGKRIGVVVNQTSKVGQTHLIDTLLTLHADIRSIFAPEHGFRGDAADGERIDDATDSKTGLPVFSLYGKQKKPSQAQLQDIDLMIYDIQDVGVRFYTFISTLHYVMEACAEGNKPLLILDRPNPNGGYIDGPVLDTAFRSFVGMHPIPVVYALTPGELAGMINGEGWLRQGIKCDLHVIQVSGYSHGDPVSLDTPPSPNLPNSQAVNLYPSLCWFEATPVSVGRGTPWPFQVIGFPDSVCGAFSFVPMPVANASPNPPQKGNRCYGVDLRTIPKQRQIDLGYLLKIYNSLKEKTVVFDRPDFFDKLAGTDQLRKAIQAGHSEAEIKNGWQSDLILYRKMRAKYTMYPDRYKPSPFTP